MPKYFTQLSHFSPAQFAIVEGMNDVSITTAMYEPQRPSATRAFFSGFGSGAFNGALMMGILFGLTKAAAAVSLFGIAAPAAATFFGGAVVATLATGLFSGVMSIKHAMSASPHAPTFIPAPAQSLGAAPALVPAIAPAMDAPEQAPAQSWVAKTGRAEGSEDRIQAIINDGKMSDKDRASAILAARETETAADVSASRR